MKPYALADKNNGIFATFDTIAEAHETYLHYVKEGIKADMEYQEETGRTTEQIERDAKDFYMIIDTKSDIVLS